MLYDRNFNFVTSGWKRVTSAAGFSPGAEITSTHEQLTINQITITDPGYIYIFVSNESEDTKVWFDDLKVTHTRSNIVAGSDFYPFGMAMENREITREEYRYGYQGQYAEKDKETGWNAFELRMYDSRIGRWTSTDPKGQYASPYIGMGNSPNIIGDPDGGWSFWAAGIGFAVGSIGAVLSGHEKDWWIWGLAGGVVGGLSFNQSYRGNGNHSEGIQTSSQIFPRNTFNPKPYISISISHFFESEGLAKTVLITYDQAYKRLLKDSEDDYDYSKAGLGLDVKNNSDKRVLVLPKEGAKYKGHKKGTYQTADRIFEHSYQVGLVPTRIKKERVQVKVHYKWYTIEAAISATNRPTNYDIPSEVSGLRNLVLATKPKLFIAVKRNGIKFTPIK